MPSRQVHRQYSGEAAAARIESRRRLLIDAAFERLTGGRSWRTLTIEGVCEEARLNKRYFYESFQDLDQLVGAVVDDIASQLLLLGQQAAADSLAEQLDTDALARRVLDAIVDWLVEDRRRAEVLFSTVSDHPGALVHRSAVVSMLAAGLSAFAVQYHGAPGPIALASIGSALLVGGTVEVLARWMRGDLDVDQEQLVEHLAGLWVAVGDHAVRSASVLDGRREPSTS